MEGEWMEYKYNDVHDDENNPYLQGGEDIDQLTALREKWFWEGRSRKTEEDYRVQK